jgi:hypothetical protein
MFAVGDDPDPYRSMSAIHDSVFKDVSPVVSVHSVAAPLGGRPRSCRFTPTRWLRWARRADRGVVFLDLSLPSVPLTPRRSRRPLTLRGAPPRPEGRCCAPVKGTLRAAGHHRSWARAFVKVLAPPRPGVPFPRPLPVTRTTAGPGFADRSAGNARILQCFNRPWGTTRVPRPRSFPRAVTPPHRRCFQPR